jgi:hypothetical protein
MIIKDENRRYPQLTRTEHYIKKSKAKEIKENVFNLFTL